MEAVVFRIDDTVVEPTLGICRVQGIRQIPVNGNLEDFFMFQSPTASVMVPRTQLIKRGVRHPMTRDEVKKIYTALKVPVTAARGDAREDYLEYQEIMRSGDPHRISKLLRKLHLLNQNDELKGKEKELMEQARRFLIEEITFVEGVSKTKVTNDIGEHLKQMVKKRAEKAKEAATAAAAPAVAGKKK